MFAALIRQHQCSDEESPTEMENLNEYECDLPLRVRLQLSSTLPLR
jgi:hypothetical protein